MKIFILLHYPGYLRYFDSVIDLLGREGHDVIIAFESRNKQPEGMKVISQLSSNVKLYPGVFPKRRDHWARFSRQARCLTDYLRYIHSDYANSPFLRQRMERGLPESFEFVKRLRHMPPTVANLIKRMASLSEQVIPVSDVVRSKLMEIDPDVVLVSPLVTSGSWQADVVKASIDLGIATGLLVGSWDHLSSKGSVKIVPDRIFVWNPIQASEAVKYHHVHPDRICITGAQPFDKWFERKPSLSLDQFKAKVGLPADDSSRFILFTGSTASISSPEAEVAFVQRWVSSIRGHPDDLVRTAPILIRPHPFNSAHWNDVAWAETDVVVFPRGGSNPVDESDRDDYFHSLLYAAVVVGINTSAMVEASILGKAVLTIKDPSFVNTQDGTIHFRYLLKENGGSVSADDRLEHHLERLAAVLRNGAENGLRNNSFVRNFIRPLGLDVSATRILADSVIALAATPRRARPKKSVVLTRITDKVDQRLRQVEPIKKR